MNTAGIGLDLVDVARIERMLARSGERLLERLLTSSERAYCLSQAVPARHVAARVAAKEAAYKALAQSGADGVVWWQDVEVVRDPAGRPSLRWLGRAQELVQQLGISSSLLSLTHSETHAAAVVVLLC